MKRYIIRGGNPLVGDMIISGAENAALGISAASIMIDDDVVIDNLPDVKDINALSEVIQEISVRADRIDRHTVKISGSNVSEVSMDDEYIRRIRASYYFIGALLGRYKSARVSLPGGCNIGSRPTDQHTREFGASRAEVTTEREAVIAHVIDLVANHIHLDMVSVGAVINIMVAATLAEGQTVLENTAKEPRIMDVANFLNNMDANIKGAGINTIHIGDANRLHGIGYSTIPDQVKAGTFMRATVTTRGDTMVKNVVPKRLEAISAEPTEIGCEMVEFDDAVRVVGKPSQRHANIKAFPYLGFPTDMQPQMSVAPILANGASMVAESIFENRFKYMDELTRMGSNMKVEGNVVVIDDVERLTGAQVNAPDLRTGAALVIAGLAADGYTMVNEIGYIQRGYGCFEEELQGLGATIGKIGSDREVQRFKLWVG